MQLARAHIISLLPTATVTDAAHARLLAAPAEALASIALDGSLPWWRRRPCALALRGRVPTESGPALFERLRDRGEVEEIRIAILEVLADGPACDEELLRWLRSEEGGENSPRLAGLMLAARARCGDLRAVPALSRIAADAWLSRREIGEFGLDALMDARGEAAVITELGAESVTTLALAGRHTGDRLLGVRLLHRSGRDVSGALADVDVVVAHAAYELLSGSRITDNAVLHALVEAGRDAVAECTSMAPSGAAGACLWALAVLHRRGVDVAPSWRALGSPRIALDGVPNDVRLAILREYVPGQRRTDPRWILEAACVPLPPPPDAAVQLRAALDALTECGVHPAEPVAAGDVYEQGAGSYYRIAVDGGYVEISTLGLFASVETNAAGAQAALVGAGFRCVDAALCQISFAGLHVYYFGARDPLAIGRLLFYWQD